MHVPIALLILFELIAAALTLFEKCGLLEVAFHICVISRDEAVIEV